MSDQRTYVMSIAGFDPTAGAGVLADIKCFEQHQVYGFGICSALTIQSDNKFIGVQWLDADEIIAQLEPLMDKFDIKACKIGLIRDMAVFQEVVNYLRLKAPDLKLVLDPVLKSSSGFEFHRWNFERLALVLTQIDLITPNYEEMLAMSDQRSVKDAAVLWAEHCAVLLKGGHNPAALGTDLLFWDKELLELKPASGKVYQKHGSGCVLSASIVSNLALGYELEESCRRAKLYTEQFLNSNQGLLGYHYED